MFEYVGPLEKQTLDNICFRQVIFTGEHSQLVLMCLAPGEDIGDEVHPTSISSSALNRERPDLSSTRNRSTWRETVMRSWSRQVRITM